MSELPAPARPLRLQDLHLLGLHPTENSTGDIVLGQLEQAALRTGIPSGIASDHGSDVKKGGELFAAQHPLTALVYDVDHHGAVVLKRNLEADDRWASLITRLGQTKALHMNIESLMRWCRRILSLLSRRGETSASERAIARYDWFEKFRGTIGEWSRWESTIRCSVALIRTQGLSRGCETQLKAAFRARPSQERHQELEGVMLEFARQQSAGLKAGERLIGSTEVLESVFGKLKTLERQESKSGLTGLVLSLGALLGTWTNSRLKAALDQTPVKHMESWLQELFPESVQSQRRLAFAEARP